MHTPLIYLLLTDSLSPSLQQDADNDSQRTKKVFVNKYFYESDHPGRYMVYVDVIEEVETQRPNNILDLASAKPRLVLAEEK